MTSVVATTHLAAFAILVPTGLTRLVRSSSLFLKHPSLFRSRPWFILSDQPRWKSLDFYALSLALPLSLLSETLLFFATTPDDHDNTTLRFSLARHSAVLLLFWALLLLIALREGVDFFRGAVNDGLVFVLAGVSFLSEYWVSGEGTDGVIADVYGSLGLLGLLCGICSFYLAVKPSSFFAEFLLSSGLVFKGTWVLQIGLCLYTDAFGLEGCVRAGNWGLKCELEEDGFRALALMRLSFVSQAVLVLVLGFVSFGVLAGNRSSRIGDHSGSLLSQLDSENLGIPNNSALPHELELE